MPSAFIAHNPHTCIGCGACQVACQDGHGLLPGEFFRRVILTENGDRAQFLSLSCAHCDAPACVEACPNGAFYRDGNGLIRHRDSLCIGCGRCVWSCPLGAVTLSKTKGSAQKCDGCIDCLEQGMEPLCVGACVNGSLTLSEKGASLSGRRLCGPAPSPVGPKTQTDRAEKILIIGGGAGAYSGAVAARKANPDCQITLLWAQTTPAPCVRPMLTKVPLTGFRPEEHSLPLDGSFVCRSNCPVEKIDPAARRVFCGGESFSYDRLILALGASAWVPPICGVERAGVFTLSTADDLHRIARYGLKCRDAVILGGGPLGLEMAYRLAEFGLNVTLLEKGPDLMPRLLDRGAAELLQAKITCFTVKTGADVTEIGDSSVTLADGTEIAAQMVLLCCGSRANVSLAEACGIAVGQGILVDDRMQTSLPDIFACGDCAQWRGGSTGLWAQAVEQGSVAGTNAAGAEAVYQGADSRLIINSPDFSLYVEGELQGADEVREESTGGGSEMTVNPRASTGLCRKYYKKGHLTGVFLLGDLTPMAALHRRLTEEKA